jgi:AraC-like DNA-binding protein
MTSTGIQVGRRLHKVSCSCLPPKLRFRHSEGSLCHLGLTLAIIPRLLQPPFRPPGRPPRISRLAVAPDRDIGRDSDALIPTNQNPEPLPVAGPCSKPRAASRARALVRCSGACRRIRALESESRCRTAKDRVVGRVHYGIGEPACVSHNGQGAVAHRIKLREPATIGHWIREERLIASDLALRNPNYRGSLAAVAQHFGFSDQPQFCRHYKQRFGRTPGDTRAEARAIRGTKKCARYIVRDHDALAGIANLGWPASCRWDRRRDFLFGISSWRNGALHPLGNRRGF